MFCCKKSITFVFNIINNNMEKSEKIVARLSTDELKEIVKIQKKHKISKSKIIRMLLHEGLNNLIIHNGYHIDWNKYSDGQVYCLAYNIKTKMYEPEIEFNQTYNSDSIYIDNFGTIVNLKNEIEVIEYFKTIIDQFNN